MLYKDQTIKITDSCDVWMTKSVVNVAAIIGYNRCHTPRHRIKEALSRASRCATWTPHFRLVLEWEYKQNLPFSTCKRRFIRLHLKGPNRHPYPAVSGREGSTSAAAENVKKELWGEKEGSSSARIRARKDNAIRPV
ncbi:hypothetical protein TNCV_4858911 [Trichonephila clavipes]|nr:hypothetical protein TNCV_4858911 [Trichonephila clavipes]